MKAGNCIYGCASDMPSVIPVFPLPEALLLPRADMPLNVFEPRYLAMIDAAVASNRIVGMVQIDEAAPARPCGPELRQVGCAGRIVSFAETGDGRYMITLTGIARFRILDELPFETPYRRCHVTAEPFACDFRTATPPIDRTAVLRVFCNYLKSQHLEADWEAVGRASDEALVNALAMMAPFGPAEKQALLEAPDLTARAEVLVAIASMALAAAPAGKTLQ